MKVEHKFFIGFRDISHLNELTNTAMLAYLENMGGIHSDLVGNGLNSGNTCTWVLLAWKVRMLKRPKFGDTIKIETWSREMEKFYAYRDYKVYNEAGDLICIATSKWVYIDVEKGRIIKVSDEVQELYQNEKVYAFSEEESKFSKLVEPKNNTSSIEFKITRNMIDTNEHLHNIYYLDIAKEVLPEKVYLNNEFNDFEVMYKKEVKCGEIVKAFYSLENGKHIITIKNNDETELHAIIVLN